MSYTQAKYIPRTFVIGIGKENIGFPSAKEPYANKASKTWTNPSIFLNHCGFKPTSQKLTDVEQKKKDAVVKTIDNSPISGFKVVSFSRMSHDRWSNDEMQYVTLFDPRGWNIEITEDNLFNLLVKNKMNLVDGELIGLKLSYGFGWIYDAKGQSFTADEPMFALVPEGDEAFELSEKLNSIIEDTADTTTYIKPSELKVGEVYSAKNGKMASSMFMYMGQHDTYSQRCHERAVRLKKYELEPFIKDRTDVTGIKKHVFYRLNGIGKYEHFGHSNDPHDSPYVVLSTANKLFDKHVANVDFSKFKLYNDESQFCTYENVKYDMSHSLLFNKVDFSNEAQTFGLVPYNVLEDFKGYVRHMVTGKFDNYAESKAWPMYKQIDGLHMYSHLYKIPFDLGAYDEYWETYPSVLNGKWERSYEKFGKFNADVKSITACKASFKAMYDKLQPKYWLYKFENGQQVPEYQNFCLNVLSYYKDIDGKAY